MPKDKLSEEERKSIIAAIQEAEKDTSGEIRVHLENHCREEVLDRAAEVFAQLKMHKTELRNGVLFYLAMKDHKLAILGDMGINQKVPEGFWENIRDFMVAQFKEGKYAYGLSEGIKMAGQQLQAHFPYQSSDRNELSDDISFNKD
ncbi:TPM domain-containing protein [Nafulsella turpanensis]|uniref:TPM domain-containing protein n=1 Tax=Nafulsella turpanensis TaxID=1265690 RepID=UPI000344EB21|nr:TPM domain-containing protein [Nafulsella turpanensis]